MNALIKILVDTMQLLQTKILDMEKAKQRTDENDKDHGKDVPVAIVTSKVICIKDCRRPPRMSAHRQPKPEGTFTKRQSADHPLSGKESG
jgi:hypothetical protein